MAESLRIAGISGSIRRGSYNRALLETLMDLAPPSLRIEPVEIRDLPFYDADFEGDGVPATVVAFRAAIAASEALLVVTPEYNYGVPGVLKNALDIGSRPPGRGALRGRKVAIAGSSPGPFGSVRAQTQLRAILHGAGADTMTRPEIVVPAVDKKLGADGRIADPATRDHLAKFLTAFEAFVRR